MDCFAIPQPLRSFVDVKCIYIYIYTHTFHIYIFLYTFSPTKFLGWLYFSEKCQRFARLLQLQAAGVFAPSRSLAGSELANQAFQLLQRIRSRTRSRVKKRPLGRTHSFGIDPSALASSHMKTGGFEPMKGWVKVSNVFLYLRNKGWISNLNSNFSLPWTGIWISKSPMYGLHADLDLNLRFLH